MTKPTSTALFVLLIAISAVPLAAWDPQAEEKARETIAEFKKKDPKLERFFAEASGWAVFPTVGKGGLGIGGARGKGTLFDHGGAAGRVTLTQVTVGFQLGGQAYSEIIFFEDDQTLQEFKSGEFEFAAQVSAVAVTLGASADANYEHGVAVFTMAKGGLMYEASVGGQKFDYRPK